MPAAQKQQSLNESEVRSILDSELRIAVHAIRDEVSKIVVTSKLHADRISDLEKLMTEHNLACSINKKTLDEVKEILTTIRAGMAITRGIKSAAVWITSVAAAVAALVHFVK
jgi:hypothetical protein